MSKIVFLEVDKEDEAIVRERFSEAVIVSDSLNDKALVETCKDAEIISTFIYSKFTEEIIKALPRLKLLCTRSVGYNHIDLDACKKQKIMVTNVPDYGSHVIAEHVFAMLLSQMRHIHLADERVESGEFDYHGLRGMSLRGKTIGVIGTGNIGRKVVEIAHGFHMQILAFDHCVHEDLVESCGVKYVELDELFEHSNIITLHVPATPETHHMINDVALHRMHRGVILVNTARGELIDTQALISAIKGNKIGYALLDVLEHEKNFEENEELINLPNVIVTPHIAFYADDSMRNMFNDCFESIESWQKDEAPRHIIHPRKIVCDLPKVDKKRK